MSTGGKNEVKEFTGMWPLKPDFDLEAIVKALSPGGLIKPPGESFSTMTTKLGLIRTARWFVGTSGEFGPTLYFITQFDGPLDKYFDDFVLNGKENLAEVWGQCVGCPTGPDATARDIVEYIARGQIKTLALFDAFPSLSFAQIQKAADWYEKTLKFQREAAKGGNLEDKVNAFFKELAEPYKPVPSATAEMTRMRAASGSTRILPITSRSTRRDSRHRTEGCWGLQRFRVDLVSSAKHLHQRSTKMSDLTSAPHLTGADLKENLHDIQDNIAAPILMRYGRHIFFKFTDGAKARAWLRNMFKLVNARPKEQGTRFTVNIGFTYEGLKALGLSQPSLDSFPEAFRVGMRGRARMLGDIGVHAPEHWEGGLGGPDIHAMGWLRTDSDEGREMATQDHSRRNAGDRRRRDPVRSGYDGARP